MGVIACSIMGDNSLDDELEEVKSSKFPDCEVIWVLSLIIMDLYDEGVDLPSCIWDADWLNYYRSYPLSLSHFILVFQ